MSADLNFEFSPDCWMNCPRLHGAIVRSLGFSSLDEFTYDSVVFLPDQAVDAINEEFADFRAYFDPMGHGSPSETKEPDRYEYLMRYQTTCDGYRSTSTLKPLVEAAGRNDPHTLIRHPICGRDIAQVGYVDHSDESVHLDPEPDRHWV